MTRFLRLAPADWALLARCACVLAVVRAALWVVPVRTLARFVAGARRAGPSAARLSAKRIAWGVQAAARHLPGASCLPQALALRFMLARHGHPARLRIGVARDSCGRLEGHAWVEDDAGRVLAGGDVTRFRAFEAAAGVGRGIAP